MKVKHALPSKNTLPTRCSLPHSPTRDRQIILDAKPVSFTVTLESLNSTIAMMAPTAFAARVWEHYSMPENGCDFIGKIIDGKVSLRNDRF